MHKAGLGLGQRAHATILVKMQKRPVSRKYLVAVEQGRFLTIDGGRPFHSAGEVEVVFFGSLLTSFPPGNSVMLVLLELVGLDQDSAANSECGTQTNRARLDGHDDIRAYLDLPHGLGIQSPQSGRLRDVDHSRLLREQELVEKPETRTQLSDRRRNRSDTSCYRLIRNDG